VSADRKPSNTEKIGPYVPAKVPDSVTTDQVRELFEINLSQYRQINEIYKDLGSHLKKLLEESGLKFWIIAAGIGAIIEGLHVLWLAARFYFKF
jgi:hypothetical protein